MYEIPEYVLENEALKRRAMHNTAGNYRQGRKITCDGYCVSDECVCEETL